MVLYFRIRRPIEGMYGPVEVPLLRLNRTDVKNCLIELVSMRRAVFTDLLKAQRSVHEAIAQQKLPFLIKPFNAVRLQG